MFTVSRTPVSETWLSPTTSIPVDSETTKGVTKKGHLSATSINSDLFPELLSWSAIIDLTQRSATLPQPIPTDVTELGEEEVEEEHDSEEEELDAPTVDDTDSDEHHTSIALDRVFDPTTITVGIDVSCFDGLDDRLIYTPMEALTEWCWSECVGAPPLEVVTVVEEDQCPTPTPPSPSPSIRRRSLFEWSSDESASDSDECATARGSEEVVRVDLRHTIELGKAQHFSTLYPIADLPPYESLYWTQDTKAAIPLPFERHNIPDPSDSVGYFPVPSQTQKKRLPRRLASLLRLGKRPVS